MNGSVVRTLILSDWKRHRPLLLMFIVGGALAFGTPSSGRRNADNPRGDVVLHGVDRARMHAAAVQCRQREEETDSCRFS